MPDDGPKLVRSVTFEAGKKVKMPSGFTYSKTENGGHYYHKPGTTRWITLKPTSRNGWVLSEFEGGCDC